MLLFAWWTGVASAAPATLEICKGGDMTAGVVFHFTITKGGVPVGGDYAVTGGGTDANGAPVFGCGAPIATTTGNVVVKEDLGANPTYMMTDIAAGANATAVRTNPANGTGTFTLGPATGGESIINVTNAPLTGTVKICKTTREPAFFDKAYSFTVNGQPASARSGTAAGQPGQCSAPFTIQPGSRINVTETVPVGQQVASVTGTNTKIISQSLTSPGTYTVKINVKTNANVLTFDNEPVAPSQRGTLEVCKSIAGDPFLAAIKTYSFKVTDSANAVTNVTVALSGSDGCTGPLDVAAGNVQVVETIPADTHVSGIAVSGSGALGPFNLVNGEATVVVPVNPGDTIVTFTDASNTASLKVCKVLSPSSSALSGVSFPFSVSDPAFPAGSPGSPTNPFRVNVIASTSTGGSCVIIGGTSNPTQFPINSTATATEDLSGFGKWVTSNQPGNAVSTVIQAGVNNLSITNQALGLMEICKTVQDVGYNGFTFTFTYQNTDPTVTDPRASGTVAVTPPHCSPMLIVPVGNYRITENLSTVTTTGGMAVSPRAFQFVSSTATGPTMENRCVPAQNGNNPNCGNPAVVSVPYFLSSDGVAYGETLVNFTNRVAKFQVKICKYIEPGSLQPLGGRSYSYNVYVNGTLQVFGDATATTVNPDYPSCTGILLNSPVIQPNGTAARVSVEERASPNTKVQSATVDAGTGVLFPGSTEGGAAVAARTVTFNPGVGPNAVSFTNMYSAT